MNQTLFALLDDNGLEYEKFVHPPVFTCDEARALIPDLPGIETKNLFLCDDKGRRHLLVAVPPEARLDLKALGELLGIKRLRFASAECLLAYLGVAAGSVSLLAVINDGAHAVEVLVDEAIWAAPAILCHPLVNTQTLSMKQTSLARFFELTGHAPQIIRVPLR
jgi:Ala-tRNA(Pro) deacylase